MPPRRPPGSSLTGIVQSPEPGMQSIDIWFMKSPSEPLQKFSFRTSTHGLDDAPMPMVQHERLPVIKFMIMFASVHWFTHLGRFLLQKELEGVLGLLCGPSLKSKSTIGVLNSVRNKDKQAVQTLENFDFEARMKFDEVIRLLYLTFLNNNPDDMDTYENLIGFLGRMPEWLIRSETRLFIAKRVRNGEENQVVQGRVSIDQFCIVYAIATVLKDKDGEPISTEDARKIATGKLRYTFKHDRFELLRRLRVPDDKMTQKVAICMADPAVKEFFDTKVQSWHTEYSNLGLLESEAWQYPSAFVASRSDPIATTTSMFSNLTVTAGAAPIMPAPDAFPWGEYTVDYESYAPGNSGIGNQAEEENAEEEESDAEEEIDEEEESDEEEDVDAEEESDEDDEPPMSRAEGKRAVQN